MGRKRGGERGERGGERGGDRGGEVRAQVRHPQDVRSSRHGTRLAPPPSTAAS